VSKVEPMIKRIRAMHGDLQPAFREYLYKVVDRMEEAEWFVLSNNVSDALKTIVHSDGFTMPELEDIHLPHDPMVVQTRVPDWDNNRVRLECTRGLAGRENLMPIGESVLLDSFHVRDEEKDYGTHLMATCVHEFPRFSDPLNLATSMFGCSPFSVLFVSLETYLELREHETASMAPIMLVAEGGKPDGVHITEENGRYSVSPIMRPEEFNSYLEDARATNREPLMVMGFWLPERYDSAYRIKFLQDMVEDQDKGKGASARWKVVEQDFLHSFKALTMAVAFTLVRTGVTYVPMQVTAVDKKKSPTGKVTKRPRKYHFTTVVLNAVEQVRGRSVEPIEHRSAHLVRGHFKQRKSGLFWWNPFVRGKGKLNKREAYQVTALEEKNDALRR